MRARVQRCGFIRHNLALVHLAEEVRLLFVPHLNALDGFVVLADAVDVPVDDVLAAVVRILRPDFHHAEAVRRLKARAAVRILVGVHVLEALRHRARDDLVEFSGEILVEIVLQRLLKLRNVRPHERFLPGQHVLRLLVYQLGEERVADFDVRAVLVLLRRAVGVDEEQAVIADVVVALVVALTLPRKLLAGGCAVTVDECADFRGG